MENTIKKGTTNVDPLLLKENIKQHVTEFIVISAWAKSLGDTLGDLEGCLDEINSLVNEQNKIQTADEKDFYDDTFWDYVDNIQRKIIKQYNKFENISDGMVVKRNKFEKSLLLSGNKDERNNLLELMDDLTNKMPNIKEFIK